MSRRSPDGAKRSRQGRDRPPSRAASEFDRLSEEIRACRKCPLGASRRHAVVYRGGAAPRLVFVGEAPGEEEDRRGLPFVGRSGRVLDAALERLPLAPDEVGILNVLKCHPPKNRFDSAAAETCRPYLDRQLELLRPVLVVPLGRVALHALDPGAPAILEVAGTLLASRRGSLFPLVHPAAALRSRRLRERWDRDVERLGAWLRAG